MIRKIFLLASLCLLSVACGSSGGSSSGGAKGTQVVFDLGADLSQADSYYDVPFPSDLRLTPQGRPDVSGFPNPLGKQIVSGLKQIAGERPGFSTVPVAFFRFNGAIQTRAEDQLIPADASSPILLIDVDKNSPGRGKLIPTIADTPAADGIYVPDNLLAVSAYPGIVLHAGRTYAFVVMRSANDAKGKPLGVPKALQDLEAGKSPGGAKGPDAVKLYAGLWDTLAQAGIDKAQVAAATVFTTGDVVQETHDMSEKLLAKYDPTIKGLTLDPSSATAPRFCELKGTIDYPQFQKGTPPYNTDGEFVLDKDGVPVQQRMLTAPLVITLPKQPMPPGGYQLVMYFHGSGGLSTQVVDRGTVTTVGGQPTPGQGPAYVLAPFNFAAAGSALPLNPERVPGASETEYLNTNNLAAFPYTFRQGVIEQRLFIKALSKLQIDPSLLAGCTGPTLPAGETMFKFNTDPLLAMGQSMGGMYTNMIGAVEPRIKAVVPTGAGGFWRQFIIQTKLLGDLGRLVGIILGLGTKAQLTPLHPALALLETGWEPAEPMVYMARLARRPLPGSPVRPIYEPVGKDDSYFPTTLYNAIVLAYGHKEAGDIIWPEMQQSLKVVGLDGILPYPVKDDLASESGTKYTGVVVQYKGDGIYDPHAIFAQLDAVKYQYGCFFKSFHDTGTAVVPAPAALGTPCPE